MWPFVIGVLATMAGVALLSGGGDPGAGVAGERPSCVVSLFLIEPGGNAGAAIDAATGGRGFSHVVAGGCELDEGGQTLIYDCRPGRGVVRAPLATYAGRGTVRIQLGGSDAAEALGCLRASLGKRYGESGSSQCATFVRDCLPQRLRERVLAAGDPSSPNSIAAAFGLSPGDPDLYLPN